MNFSIPTHLSPTLEKQRSEIEKSFAKAFQRVERFADTHGWKNLTKDPFIKGAHIFDSKPGFDQHIRKLIGQDIGANIPASFSAALEKMDFVSVSPELYLEIFPEGKEADYFEKLIAHEIIHRLHIRILKGDEDAMGPVWFYEGLARCNQKQILKRSHGVCEYPGCNEHRFLEVEHIRPYAQGSDYLVWSAAYGSVYK